MSLVSEKAFFIEYDRMWWLKIDYGRFFCLEISFLVKYYKYDVFPPSSFIVGVLVWLERLSFAWPPCIGGK